MLCYRDRCFCNAPCKKQGVSCSSSFEYAVIEKSKSNEHFINTTIPVCGSDLSDVCFLFEPLDDEVNV
ncbi:MAG: hypothetical protein JHC33_07075 [Ignisphaera sp.]|nr:hypothetical protein [Ignisphaera sp.]